MTKRYRKSVRPLGDYADFATVDERIDEPSLPYRLEVTVTQLDDGRAGCSRLVVEQRENGPPVTSDGIRQLPLATLIRARLAKPGLFLKRAGAGFEPVFATDDDYEQELAGYLKERQAAERRGRRRVTDDDLRMVAETYRRALSTGQPPGVEVKRVLKLRTPEQARRWISKAREAGFLGEAPGPRQMGERR